MKPGRSTLLFQHPNRKIRRTPLRAFLNELTAKVTEGRPVTCLITTDAELQRLNREFRHKDYATDVLSFPAGDGSGEFHELGEMAISLDRAAAQAEELGHDTDAELRILMLHGALHLAGLDHETDTGVMARAERKWRKQLGLPAGLIERAG